MLKCVWKSKIFSTLLTPIWRCLIKFTFKLNDNKIVNFSENQMVPSMALEDQELRTCLFSEKMVMKFDTDFHRK